MPEKQYICCSTNPFQGTQFLDDQFINQLMAAQAIMSI